MIAVAAKIYKVALSLEDGPHMNGDTQDSLFSSCDLDLDPVTSVHTLNLAFVKM